jgi:hypothetical protein
LLDPLSGAHEKGPGPEVAKVGVTQG